MARQRADAPLAAGGGPSTRVRTRRRASTVLAAVALLLAIGQVVWTAAFLDDAGDGPAFAVGLVGLLATPACVVVGAVLLTPASRRTLALVAGLAICLGLAVASVVAGVFVGDEPVGPRWIAVVAGLFPYAVVAALLVAGALVWWLLPIPSPIARLLAAVPVVLVGVALGAVLLLQAPVTWLAAVALCVVLVVLRVGERRRDPGA